MGAGVSHITAIHMSLGQDIRTYLGSYLYIVGGFILIVAGIIMIIAVYMKYRHERELNEVDAVNEHIREIQKLAGGAREDVTLPAYPTLPSQEPYPTTKVDDCCRADEEETLLLEQFVETQILAEQSPALLRLNQPGGEEVVLVDKPEFLLGRNRMAVDYCITGSNNVGRIHAKMVYEKGVYYLVDLDSRNGTYLNGEKLSGNKPYPLDPGDTIRLADVEFTFDLWRPAK